MSKVNHKIILKASLPIIVSILILYFLFLAIGTEEVIKELTHINLYGILIALTVYSLIKIVNTYRYKFVYDIKQNTLLVFYILNFCNMVLNIIPLRLGEISYVSQLNKYFDIPKTKAAARLVYIRSIDYIAIYLGMVASMLFVSSTISSNFIRIVIITFLVLTIFFGIFIFISRKSESISNYLSSLPIISKVTGIIFQGLDEIKEIGRDKFMITLLLSFAYWFLRLFMGYLILLVLGLDLSFGVIVFISLALLLVGLLPINAFAGFGTTEVTWVYLLQIFNYSPERSLAIILKFHIITLIPVIIYGLISYLMLKFRRPQH